MQFTVFWIYIIDIETRYITNMKTCSVYIVIRTETSQRINAVHSSREICLSVYNIYI